MLGLRLSCCCGVKGSLELLQLKRGGGSAGAVIVCLSVVSRPPSPPSQNQGLSPQSGSYLGQADADRLLEEGPEDALEAGGGGEGPVVAVVEVQAWGQQVLHAEGGDGRCLPWEWGGKQLRGAQKGSLGSSPRCHYVLSLLSPLATPLLAHQSLTCIADAPEMAQDVVVGGVGVSTHLGGARGWGGVCVRAGGLGGGQGVFWGLHTSRRTPSTASPPAWCCASLALV